MCELKLKRVLKFIDNYNEKQGVTKEQGFEYKKYSSIVRACLDVDILQLLLINCWDNNITDIDKFRQLMEKYNMLEHMPIEVSNIMCGYLEDFKFIYKKYIIKVVKEYKNKGYKNIFWRQWIYQRSVI